MNVRRLLFALLFSVCVRPGLGGVIYEASENPSNVVGAFDVNILADDVHFRAGGQRGEAGAFQVRGARVLRGLDVEPGEVHAGLSGHGAFEDEGFAGSE